MSLKIIMNQDEIERNELNVNAMGGTEMMQKALQERLPKDISDQFQIIPSRVRDIDSNKLPILWLHDLAEDPESQHLRDRESRSRFKRLVFVSHWQFSTYNKVLGVPYNESIVLKNAIDPIPNHTKPKDGPIRLIYHTTPHRGLDILVAVFEQMAKKWGDRIHLDVYSSFKIYGWEQRDEEFKEVFDRCREHDNITYHGSVPNHEVRKALENSHIFAYPCTWQETSCIAAIEAMSAGCAIVCPSLAALPETTSNFALMYPHDEDKMQHAHMFYQVLDAAIEGFWEEDMQTKLQFQRLYTNTFYGWDLRSQEREGLLRSISEQEKVQEEIPPPSIVSTS